MKKVISLLLAVVMLCSTFAGLQITSSAADLPSTGQCGDSVYYALDASTGILSITGSGKMWNPMFSSDAVFYNQPAIKAVVICEGVTSVGEFAFYNCRNLKTLTLPRSLKSIGGMCTMGTDLEEIHISDLEAWCKVAHYSYDGVCLTSYKLFLNGEQVTDLVIPDTVTEISANAFDECIGIKSVVIPASMTKIGMYAFCLHDLEKLTILGENTKFENCAFNGCNALKELTIPASAKLSNDFDLVESLHPAFSSSTNIEKVIITKGTGTMQDYGTSSWSDTEIPTYYQYTPWYISRNNIKKIELEEGIENIGTYAFCGCTGLSEIKIPKSVKTVGEHAFSDCSNLQAIKFYSPFTKIEDSADTIDPAATIYGYQRSTAQAYAEKYNRKFVPLGIFDCEQFNFKHVYVDVKINATKFSLGYTSHTCAICGKNYSDTYTAATGTISGLKCQTRTMNAETIVWNNEVNVSGYQIQISDKSGKNWANYYTLDADVNSMSFKNLEAGGNYKFRIRFFIQAEDGKNYFSAWSATLSSSTIAVPNVKISGFKCSARTAVAQKVVWNKVNGATGYQVQISNAAGNKWAEYKTLNAKYNYFVFAKLTAGSNYKFRVRYYTKAEDGMNYFGAWVVISSPTLPANTYFTAKSTPQRKCFALSWKQAKGISGYQIQTATNARFSKGLITYNIKSTSKNAIFKSGIKSGRVYYARIRTYRVIGGKAYFSAWGKAVAVKTK